jgi:hypothetical protein
MTASTTFGNPESPKKPVRKRLLSDFPFYASFFEKQSSAREIPFPLEKAAVILNH